MAVTSHQANIDLELGVRIAHKHYLATKGTDRQNALLDLTIAAELYRKYGPFCTEDQYRERFKLH